ncbi:hypothetical protein [Dongia sp.]|uniref:hypothetical protein n=1 Tax=Dongia sp. TaxID=1977262 RepID=UPI0035B4EA4F
MAANDNHCTDHAEPAAIQIEQLPFAAQFAIWAARAWVTALKLDQPFSAVSHGTFERFDLDEAENDLDALFSIVAHSASRQIDIRCLKCSHVSPDEMLFQQAVAAVQGEDSLAAYEALRAWLPPAAARTGLRALTSFANRLSQRELRLSKPLSSAPRSHAHMRADLPSVALH